MPQYGNDTALNDFDWEDEEEFDFLSQQFEKRAGRQSNNRKVDTRRKIEDHQEKRRLKNACAYP